MEAVSELVLVLLTVDLNRGNARLDPEVSE